jgi:hypothetical protein
MAVATAVVALLSLHYTSSLLPGDPRLALVFQNALLLIVLGSALLEHHYTKPADSVVNSLMGFITLLTVYSEAPRLPWVLVSVYCIVVFLLSTACVAVSSGSGLTGWKDWVAKRTYRPSVVLGRARVLFTIVFLAGLWFFVSLRQACVTCARAASYPRRKTRRRSDGRTKTRAAARWRGSVARADRSVA